MLYEDQTDEELFLLYQKGDVRAFDHLLSRHKKGLYHFLYRQIPRADHAEEAFQEVFLRIIKSVSKYSPQAKFTTWMYTIARNYCIDYSRGMKFRNLEEGVDENEVTNSSSIFVDKEETSERQLESKELGKKINEALDELNTDQKEVFLLREFEGMSFEEIAKVTASSVNTVKSRMRYALAFLREKLS